MVALKAAAAPFTIWQPAAWQQLRCSTDLLTVTCKESPQLCKSACLASSSRLASMIENSSPVWESHTKTTLRRVPACPASMRGTRSSSMASRGTACRQQVPQLRLRGMLQKLAGHQMAGRGMA